MENGKWSTPHNRAVSRRDKAHAAKSKALAKKKHNKAALEGRGKWESAEYTGKHCKG